MDPIPSNSIAESPPTVTDEQCRRACPSDPQLGAVINCQAGDSPDGGYLIACYYQASNPCLGRRPEGLAEAEVESSPCAVGMHLAYAAHLEAASVPAFVRLASDLGRLGAPRRLVRAAQAAARDEARHARVTARLARAHSARVPRVQVAPARPRSLEELARENAVEGCVFETYAAALAQRQALTAALPAVRRALARIARDEAAHAALSWEIAAWAEGQLGPTARARLASAKRQAVQRLRRQVKTPLPQPVVGPLGLPDADEAQRLVETMDRELWRSRPSA